MASFPEIRFHRWALPEIRFYWGMDQISNTRMMVSHHIVLRERLIQLKEGESLNAYNSIKIIPIRRELTVLFWNIFSPPTTLCLHRVIVMQKQWYAVVLVMMILIGVIYGIWSLLTEIPTQGIPNSLNIIQHIFAAIFFLYKWYRSYIGHLFLCLIYTFFKARKLYVHSSSESWAKRGVAALEGEHHHWPTPTPRWKWSSRRAVTVPRKATWVSCSTSTTSEVISSCQLFMCEKNIHFVEHTYNSFLLIANAWPTKPTISVISSVITTGNWL